MKRFWRQAIIALVPLLILLGTTPSHAAYEEIIYYHNDALGSPVLATTANGAVKWRENYSAYGSRLTLASRETNCSPLPCKPIESPWDEKQWFTGKLEETRVGLQYFGARWYEPELGRFLSPDPVQFNDSNIFSFNRYSYANNNPYKFVDPDGRYASPIHGLISFIALTLSGKNPLTATIVTSANILSDFNWYRPGTQDIQNSNMHAMAEPNQSKDQAKMGTDVYIHQQAGAGTFLGLANALHANEDRYSDSHEYQEWDGHLTLDHAIGDWTPSISDLRDAISTDMDVIDQYDKAKH
jgi:RHS repeat-associated protein